MYETTTGHVNFTFQGKWSYGGDRDGNLKIATSWPFWKSNSKLIGTFVVDDGPESVRIHKDAEEDSVETYFMDVYGVYKKTFGAKLITLHNFNTWGIHVDDTEILAFQEIGPSFFALFWSVKKTCKC